MAQKYIKDGQVAEGYFVTEQTIKDGDTEKTVTVKVHGATDKEWREAGYIPVEEHFAKAIADVKKQLAASDYIALKSVEGYDVDALYPDWKANRAALRDQINALEAERDSILGE